MASGQSQRHELHFNIRVCANGAVKCLVDHGQPLQEKERYKQKVIIHPSKLSFLVSHCKRGLWIQKDQLFKSSVFMFKITVIQRAAFESTLKKQIDSRSQPLQKEG